GRPEFPVLFVELADARVDIFQADSIGVPHGTATVRREAIAIEVDDIDIDGTESDAFFQDTCTFVDESVDEALDNLFFCDIALLNARLRSLFADIFFHDGIRNGAAIFIIFVPAGAGLLAVAAHFAETVFCQWLANTGFFQMLKLLADAPAYVKAGKVAHGERA